MRDLIDIQGLFTAGRADEARAALRPWLKKHPPDAAAHMLMSVIAASQGEREQGLFYARRAAEARTDDPSVLMNTGNALTHLGDPSGAVAVFERIIAAQPRWDQPRTALVHALLTAGRLTECAARCRQELALMPDHPRLLTTLGSALLAGGRAREAGTVFEGGAQRWMEEHTLASNWCAVGHYCGDRDAGDHARAARHFGALLGKRVRPMPAPGPREPGPLRIGLLSPDLRDHAVAWFLWPLIEHHDRATAELTVFSTAAAEDAVSRSLRALAPRWRSLGPADAASVAARVREDRIDVLVDLSGHTSGHRLAALAMRPARTQVGYFGFPNTTGVPGLGWRIVDGVTDPPTLDEFSTEKLLRLDRPHVCYRPPAGAPAPGRDGPRAAPVFGSFSAVSKLDELCLALWADTLKATPGSSLYLKHQALRDAGVRADVAARFAALGIGPERLRIEAPASSAAELMACYRLVDVALDTFPYNGVTTTCEALYMGVPVVSLAGDPAEGRMGASRVGKSLLPAAGLGDLVAGTPEEFTRAASALAQDRARIDAMRGSLRGAVLAGPLCDGPGFARDFVAALARAHEEALG